MGYGVKENAGVIETKDHHNAAHHESYPSVYSSDGTDKMPRKQK